jgi:hypothetical protein
MISPLCEFSVGGLRKPDQAGRLRRPFILTIVINLLLFVPLGFGLVMMARGKGLRPKGALLLVLLLGAGVSLGVEVLQWWLPVRDPSLIDIAANSTSSMLGAVLYLVAGGQHWLAFTVFCARGTPSVRPKRNSVGAVRRAHRP